MTTPAYSPSHACGLPQGAPPGVGYNKVRSRSFGPLVEVLVNGMFSKESSTRLSRKHLLFEPYLDHQDNYSQGDQLFQKIKFRFSQKIQNLSNFFAQLIEKDTKGYLSS